MKLDNLPNLITEAVKNVIGKGPVKLHEPKFDGNEIQYVQDCIKSTYVSSTGPYVERFEFEISKFTGAKYSVSVVNGTAALHLALKLAGVKKDDEVLLQAFNFVACANAISYCGAIPHFVDIESSNLGIDPLKLRDYLKKSTKKVSGLRVNRITGKIIRALVVMHTFGHASQIDELLEIGKEFNLKVIEDAAEAIGSYYLGKHLGTMGYIGTLSFNGNKTITTGGGGAILTNDKKLAEVAKHLSTTAKIPHPWEFAHDRIGYNYRMPNLNAALGCAQLEKLPQKLKSKRALFYKYKQEFVKISEVKLLEEPKNSQSNFWLQTIILCSPNLQVRDKILENLNRAGYMSRPGWKLLNSLDPYLNNPSMDLDISKRLYRSVINIPSFP